MDEITSGHRSGLFSQIFTRIHSQVKKENIWIKPGKPELVQETKQGLIDHGFTPSEINPCLYLKNNMVLLTYVDHCLIISPSKTSINCLILSMQTGPENFKLTG